MLTGELTQKSDVYSYGVLLLELVRERPPKDLVDPAAGDSFDAAELRTIATVAEWCTRSDAKSRPSIKQVLVELYEGLDPVHRYFAGAAELSGQGPRPRNDVIPQSGLQSSSSTSRSYCSRSFLLESGSPQSPQHGLSL